MNTAAAKDSGQFVYFIDISTIYKVLYLLFTLRLTGLFIPGERDTVHFFSFKIKYLKSMDQNRIWIDLRWQVKAG